MKKITNFLIEGLARQNCVCVCVCVCVTTYFAGFTSNHKKRNIIQHITIIRLIDTGHFLTRTHMSIAIQEKKLRFVLFGPKATIIG